MPPREDPLERYRSRIFSSVRQQKIDDVRELLSTRPEAMVARREQRGGKTFLHVATTPAMVDMLCVLGADPNATSKAGKRPIDEAMKAGRISVVEALRRNGAHASHIILPHRHVKTEEMRHALLEGIAGSKPAVALPTDATSITASGDRRREDATSAECARLRALVVAREAELAALRVGCRLGMGAGVAEIPEKHVREDRAADKGSFGVVFRAKLVRDPSTWFALKRAAGARSARKSFMRDCEVASRVARFPHPNIARLVGIVVDPDVADPALRQTGILSEWVEGGSLQDLDKGALPLHERLTIALHMTLAVAHLHDVCDVLHRDLHLGNFLYMKDGTAGGVVKLTDFGQSHEGLDAAAGSTLLNLLCIAPEVQRGELASPGSDVFGLGLCVYQVLSGCRAAFAHPRGAEETEPVFITRMITRKASATSREELAGDATAAGYCSDVTVDLREAVAACFDVDPAARPSAQELAGQLYLALRAAEVPVPAEGTGAGGGGGAHVTVDTAAREVTPPGAGSGEWTVGDSGSHDGASTPRDGARARKRRGRRAKSRGSEPGAAAGGAAGAAAATTAGAAAAATPAAAAAPASARRRPMSASRDRKKPSRRR